MESHEKSLAHALKNVTGLFDNLDKFLESYIENYGSPPQKDILREGIQLIVRQRVISELESMRLALHNLKENKDG